MGTLANLVVSLSLKDDLTKGLSGVANKLNGVASDFRKVGGVLTAGVTLPLVALGTQLVSAASDLNESQSAVNTVFGDSAKVITDFSKTSATAMGISQSAYLGAASGLGALFTGMGLSDKTSANFSSNILQNASDLASFYNTDPGTALQDLQSGLVGEAEPLRKYGILLTEAAVQQKAMEQTGKANAKQLTESEKVTARYALIQEQLGAAQGDFARTSGGLANQQRILRAQLQDTAAQMGQILLPYVLQAVKAFSGLLQWVQKLSPKMQKFAVIAGVLAAAIGPLLLVIGTLIPALTALAPLFGLLLGPIGLVIAAVALLTAAYLGNWFGFADAVNAVVDAFKNLLKTKTVITFLNGLEKAIMRPIAAMKKMGEALLGIGKAIMSGDFRGALQQGRKFLAGFGDYLASPAKAIGSFLKGITTGFAPLDNVLHTAGKLFTDFGRLVQEVFQGDLSGAMDVAGRIFGNLGDLGQQAWDLLKAGFDAINWGAVWDTVTSGISTAAGKVIDILDWTIHIGAPKLLGWIVDVAGNIWGWIKGKLGLNGGTVGDGTGGPETDIQPISITDWTIDVAIPKLTGWIVDAASDIWGAVKKLANWSNDKILAPFGDWALNTVVPDVIGWVKVHAGDLWDAIKKIVGWPDALTVPIPSLTIDTGPLQDLYDKLMGWAGKLKDAWDAITRSSRDPNANYQTQYQNTYGVNPNTIKPGDEGAPLGSNYGFNLGVEATPQSAMGSVLGLVKMQTEAQSIIDKIKGMEGIGTPLKVATPDTSPFTTAMDTIGTLTGTMVGNVAALMGQNTRNIGQAMSDALSAASTYSNAIYTVVSTNIGRMVGNVAALVGAVPGIVTGAMNDAAASGGAAAYNAGLSIGAGLANGMAAMQGQVEQAAANLANAATSAARAALLVKSPSRVFQQIGAYVGDGFADGIESRYSAASRAGNGLAAAAIPGIGGSHSGAATGSGHGLTNYGTIRVEAANPEDFYIQWRQQQIGGVRR